MANNRVSSWPRASTHGAPAQSTPRSNPQTHSKATRRYGTDGSKGNFPNSSTGSNPARPVGLPGRVGVSREHPVMAPRGESVGHATDGSGKFRQPSYPLRSKGAAGEPQHHQTVHAPRGSPALDNKR